MDWKAYYRNELSAPGSRGFIVSWLTTQPDERVAAAVARGAILSFPHTALEYSGQLQATVASALFRQDYDRVIALGVLHSGSLPAYQTALDDGASPECRADAFETVSGAFAMGADAVETPFGVQPSLPASEGPICDDVASLLVNEFSLDTFAAVLRLAADVFGQPPIPILPLFIGMMRDPVTGQCDKARELGQWLRKVVDSRTALVATGDLVHYGAAYGLAEEDAELAELAEPALERAFRSRVESMLVCAMDGRGEEAYRANLLELRNDQREILPVLAEFLGAGAKAEILSFELSDYASILSVEKPCLVASALVAYG